MKALFVYLGMLVSSAASFGQGAVSLDNSAASEGIVVNCSVGPSASGYGFYTGPAGIQVWYSSSRTYDLTASNWIGYVCSSAHAQLTTDNFTLATAFIGATIISGGFSLGDLH